MANNRLYIGDTKSGLYQYLTKGYGYSWAEYNLDGMVKNFKHFMEENTENYHETVGTEGGTTIVIFTEQDEEFEWFFKNGHKLETVEV